MLDEHVIDAVATGNLKAISEQPALLSNLAYSNAVSTNNLGQQNAVAHQRAGQQVTVPIVAKAVNTIGNIDPMASRSAVDVLTNDELAQTIADLKSVIDAFANDPSGGWWLRDLQLRIDEHQRLVIGGFERETLEIVIPGSFTNERVRVRTDTNLGTIITVTKSR